MADCRLCRLEGKQGKFFFLDNGYWQPVVNSDFIDNRLSIAIDNWYSLAVI